VHHRIVLIHAVSMAINPIKYAFTKHWPEAEIVNFLDDSLSSDRATSTGLDSAMMDRFSKLGDYAASINASGILFTCSAFGPAIDMVAKNETIPVLRPNEAMFDLALKTGRRIGMLTTFENSIASMTKEFDEMSKNRRINSILCTHLVPGAMEKLKKGDSRGHDKLVAEAAKKLDSCDTIMLAQFSMAPAKKIVSDATDKPVLTAPEAAAQRMKTLLLQ